MSLPASPSEIVALMRLLTDPTRWRIYDVLRQRSASVGELADILAMPDKLVSHHLQVLRRAGLVQAERDATDARWVYYHLDDARLTALRLAFLHLFDPTPLTS